MSSYLKTFAPWIAYTAGAVATDWRVGAAAALATGVVVVARDRRAGGADLLTMVTTALFAGVLAVGLVAPDVPVHQYLGALSLGCLGLAATASVLVRRPFTATIARRTTPPELWDTPLFARVNTVITSVWAASFLVSSLVCAVVAHQWPEVVPAWVAVQVVGFAIPARFTSRYPERVRARLLGPAPAPAAG